MSPDLPCTPLAFFFSRNKLAALAVLPPRGGGGSWPGAPWTALPPAAAAGDRRTRASSPSSRSTSSRCEAKSARRGEVVYLRAAFVFVAINSAASRGWNRATSALSAVPAGSRRSCHSRLRVTLRWAFVPMLGRGEVRRHIELTFPLRIDGQDLQALSQKQQTGIAWNFSYYRLNLFFQELFHDSAKHCIIFVSVLILHVFSVALTAKMASPA